MSRRRSKKIKPKPLTSTEDKAASGGVATESSGSALSRRDASLPEFTFLGDGREQATPARFAEAFGQLMQVSLGRAKFLGQLLSMAYESDGTKAFWDEIWKSEGEDGGSYKAGEYVRALVQLEAQERDRAARLLESALRFGIEAKNADLRQDQVRTLVLSLKNLASELGVPDTPDTRRLMQRAVLEARKTVLADAGT